MSITPHHEKKPNELIHDRVVALINDLLARAVGRGEMGSPAMVLSWADAIREELGKAFQEGCDYTQRLYEHTIDEQLKNLRRKRT